MRPKKNKEFYTDEELTEIKEQWLKDKTRIDHDMEGRYSWDIDQEYKHHLYNKDLQKLFGHAAYLFRGIREGDMFIYPNEEAIFSKVYQEILKNGYFTASKNHEKKITSWLGKAVKRQTHRRFRK